MSRGLKDIRVANLFKRKSEISVALDIKNASLGEAALVDLSQDMVALQHNYKLHPDTLRQLHSPLYTVTSPLARYIYKDALDQLGSTEDRLALTTAYLNTDSIELCTLSSDVLADEHIVDTLLAEGDVGCSVLRHAYLANKWTPMRTHHWHLLFKYAIESENFQFASKLWKAHYEGNLALAPPSLIAKFLILASHQRNGAINELYLNTELPASSALSSAVLACSLNDKDTVQDVLKKLQVLIEFHEDDLASLQIRDFTQVADRLARAPMDVIDSPRPQLVFNLLLLGAYRQYSSQTVLHIYRYLVNNHDFKPNMATAQILANSAYRLGNSKLLGYKIWQDMAHLDLTRKFCETMLMCQLVGAGYKSSLYFLQEMYRRRIHLRTHIQRMLSNKFTSIGDEHTFVDLFKSHNIGNELAKYGQFDEQLVKEECGTYLAQAERNASIFVEGRKPQQDPLVVLGHMLEFDSKLKST